jgi:multiple sugar transport system substrate-binding protein
MMTKRTAASLLALSIGLAAATAAGAQSLEYWVYSDFAQGEAWLCKKNSSRNLSKPIPASL